MRTMMIDSGIILRALVGPHKPEVRPAYEEAARLLRSMDAGEMILTATDAAISETVIALSSPRHYGLRRRETAERMRVIVGHAGFRMPGKTAVLAALARWQEDPSLDFSDALTIERAREGGMDVASHRPAVIAAAGYDYWERELV
ncbi:MAG: hypothetical protein ACKOWF_06425 [Chloroflexota bacterium]